MMRGALHAFLVYTEVVRSRYIVTELNYGQSRLP